MKVCKASFFVISLILFVSFAAFSSAQDPTAIVNNAYQDILGRKADQQGLRNFRSKILDEGWTEKQVRDALQNSPEYAQIIINRAYEDILNRKPDRTGLEFYQKHIINDNWSEKQVRDSLRQSQEYKSKNG